MSVPAKTGTDTRDNHVRFLLNGVIHEAPQLPATTTVLNYLREHLHMTGTKEGCAEGDCGACTVVLVESREDGLRFRPVNSCIQFLPTLDGKALYTVEGLKSANTLHPVQQAMVECHGSQCGFCTPGFVMSLFALYKNRDKVDRHDIDTALSGNLCRCTGYRPIIDAARKMYTIGEALPVEAKDLLRTPGKDGDGEALRGELEKMERHTCLSLSETGRYFAPLELEELAALYLAHPDATLLAGGTDVGLWVTKQFRQLSVLIYTGNVKALGRISETEDCLEIGAGVNLEDAFVRLLQVYPGLEEVAQRFASPPIRSAGTLCGNIANASPIGDSMPALISLGAGLVLRRGEQSRECPLDSFYLDYQETALEKGEFVQAVRVPKPQSGQVFRSYKISRRFDQDISALCGAFSLALRGKKVMDLRIAYGGMAAIPKRARHCEAALLGREWNDTNLTTAITALAGDFEPLSDMRASAGYRSRVAANLLRRFYLDSTARTEPLQVLPYAAGKVQA